jgi:hypothetical protein
VVETVSLKTILEQSRIPEKWAEVLRDEGFRVRHESELLVVQDGPYKVKIENYKWSRVKDCWYMVWTRPAEVEPLGARYCNTLAEVGYFLDDWRWLRKNWDRIKEEVRIRLKEANIVAGPFIIDEFPQKPEYAGYFLARTKGNRWSTSGLVYNRRVNKPWIYAPSKMYHNRQYRATAKGAVKCLMRGET